MAHKQRKRSHPDRYCLNICDIFTESFLTLSQRISSAFLDVHIMFLPFCCVYLLHLSQFFFQFKETENNTRAPIDLVFLFSYLTRYLTGEHRKRVSSWTREEKFHNYMQPRIILFIMNTTDLCWKENPTLFRHEKNKDSQWKKIRKVRRRQGSRCVESLQKQKMGVTYNSQSA